jgi:hypothetical protein
MGHYGYRVRRLITFVSGFDDFGMLWWSFLCYGRSTRGIFLGWKFRISMLGSFHLLASVYVDIALQKKSFIVQVLRMNRFRLNFHAFCFFGLAAALIFGRELFRRAKSLAASYRNSNNRIRGFHIKDERTAQGGFLHTSYVHALTNKERILMKLSKSTF